MRGICRWLQTVDVSWRTCLFLLDEPFILATQATQVYYVEDPIDAEWSTVVVPSLYDIE